ncbi:MAG TPA: DUF305 domain-containing protein [Flavipsychrobacter sp.]
MMHKGNYGKLAMSLGISFVIMYLVMFLNIDSTDHFYISLTRAYMALLMVAPMALLMLLLMGKMYPDKKTNAAISISATVAFILALVLLRQQVPIGDRQYMKAMIPHHSSAILTSENADIQDPEVQQLAKQIIETQEREIAQMKNILERMERE